MPKPNNEAISKLRQSFDKIKSARAFSSPEAQKALGDYSNFLFSDREGLNSDQVNRLKKRMTDGFASTNDIPDVRYTTDNQSAYNVINTFNKRMFPSSVDSNQTFIDLGGRPALTGNFETGKEVIKNDPTVIKENVIKYNLYPDKKNVINDDEMNAAKRMQVIDKSIAGRYHDEFIKGTDLEQVYDSDNAMNTYQNINSNPELKARFSKMYWDDNKWKQMVAEEGSKLGYENNYTDEYFKNRNKIYGKDVVGGDGVKEYTGEKSLYGFRNSLATIDPTTNTTTLNNDIEIPTYETKEWKAGARYRDDDKGSNVKGGGSVKPGFHPREVLCGVAKAPRSKFAEGGVMKIKKELEKYKKSL